MKKLICVISFSALSACSSVPTETSATAPISITSEAIIAFNEICLKTAPSFSGAADVAKKFDINKLEDMGFMKMGGNADNSLSIQVQSNQCTVTTPSKSDNSLTAQFLALIGKTSNLPTPKMVPAKVVINNQNYIVMHDRKGGEAFVIMKI